MLRCGTSKADQAHSNRQAAETFLPDGGTDRLNHTRQTDDMKNKGFIDIRKKLDKTQKELASLLGISLKAVCSYEQGWRTIPSHVERQLTYLLAKKFHAQHETGNCWDIRNCPDEKKMKCPAWEFSSGDYCWFISGTICSNTAHVSWDKKIEVCKKCVVMKDLV